MCIAAICRRGCFKSRRRRRWPARLTIPGWRRFWTALRTRTTIMRISIGGSRIPTSSSRRFSARTRWAAVVLAMARMRWWATPFGCCGARARGRSAKSPAIRRRRCLLRRIGRSSRTKARSLWSSGGTWRFAGRAKNSPARFAIPNRRDRVVQITGRAANAQNIESLEGLALVTRWRIGGGGLGVADHDVPPEPTFGAAVHGDGTIELGGSGSRYWKTRRGLRAVPSGCLFATSWRV